MARIFLSPPHMGGEERTLLLEAFDSNWIAPLGPQVDAFELELAQRVGVGHGAALSSGTAALHLALVLVGVGPGDEVLVPSLTFVATANAVVYLGATPVFIDSHPTTWTMDPELLDGELAGAARRGRLPAAVVTVDLYGQCADYDPILACCARWGVPVVEDAAEALGASYRGQPAGSFGDMGVFSFNGNKIITTSGGGMLVSRSAEKVARARFLAAQARDPAPHYQHSEIGYNYRLSNLLAAVGRGQLRHLDQAVQRRQEVNATYRAELAEVPGLEVVAAASYGEPSCWLTCITVDPSAFGATREDIRLALEDLDIEARPTWKPLHLQPAFAGCRSVGGQVAEQTFAVGLCLPSGTSLTPADQARVVAGIRAVQAAVG